MIDQEIRDRETRLDLLDIAGFAGASIVVAVLVSLYGVPALLGIAGLTVGYILGICTRK